MMVPAGRKNKKITASDAAAEDHFGLSVSIHVNLAIVGAPFDDDKGDKSGSVYFFGYSGSWFQTSKFTANDGAANDQFGTTVSIDGTWAVVGSPYDDDKGSIYFYVYNTGTWFYSQKKTASDGQTDDYFGKAVHIEGTNVIVGASGDDDYATKSGAAYIFELSGTWQETQKLYANAIEENSNFGESVKIVSSYAIVGSSSSDVHGNTNAGAAYIYKYDGTYYTGHQKIVASDGGALDTYGSVGISDNYAIIGAPFDDDNVTNGGSAYIYYLTGINDSSTICDGSAITLEANGSSFQWSDGITDGMAFTPTASATYYVTINKTGGGTCNDSTTVMLYSPQISQESPSDITCNGLTDGKLDYAASSPYGTITYAISTGSNGTGSFTGLSAGEYQLTVTDTAGCSSYGTTLTIAEPADLDLVGAATEKACYGENGRLVFTATGGTQPYSFIIGDGSTGIDTNSTGTFLIQPGTYTMTLTDTFNCATINSTPQVLNEYDEYYADAGADKEICAGESVSLEGVGGASYEWEDGIEDGVDFTPTATTTYSMTGTDANGCTDTDNMRVTVNSLPNLSLVSTKDTIENGSSATLTASGGSTYVWSVEGWGEDTLSISPTANTTYYLTGTDANGCSASAEISIVVIKNTSIQELAIIDISIYPNPSSGILYYESDMPIGRIEIYNQSTLLKTIAYVGKNQINLSGFPPGVYYFAFYQGDKRVIRKVQLIK